MKWNERITVAREALGINKAEFARRVGVSSATTADWETGKIKMIDGEHLVKVARVLNVTAEWIISGGAAGCAEYARFGADAASVYQRATAEGRAFLRNTLSVIEATYAAERRIHDTPVEQDRRKPR